MRVFQARVHNISPRLFLVESFVLGLEDGDSTKFSEFPCILYSYKTDTCGGTHAFTSILLLYPVASARVYGNIIKDAQQTLSMRKK